MSPPSSPQPAARPSPTLLWLMVLGGIVSISFASILIRLADAPSLAVAAARVTLATAVLGPFYARRAFQHKEDWSPKIVAGCLLSGFFLAFHFIFWIESIGLTSIASSATLVSTTPIFSAFFSRFLLGEKAHRTLWWGLALTLVGSAVVAGADFSPSSDALLGDILALLGAAMAAGYLMSGRLVRQTLQLSTYVFVVYGVASAVLLASCAVTQTPLLGYTRETYTAMILLALVPQLIGHTTFNWTLKFLSPTTVAVLILGEPIGATLLAYVTFGETLTWGRALGLLVLGAGIVLCSKTTPTRALPGQR